MGSAIALLGFIGAIVSITMTIISAVKKSSKVKFWSIGIAVCFVLFFVGAVISGNNQNSTASSSTENVTTVVNIQQFQSQCQNISYDELARNPNKYPSSKVTFTGKVIQVMEAGNSVTYRINVTADETGDYATDTLLVTYKPKANESRILEDDTVVLYGTYKGLQSYQSTLGEQITIPKVDAVSIQQIKG